MKLLQDFLKDNTAYNQRSKNSFLQLAPCKGMQGSAHLCSPLFFLSASHTLPPVHPWLLPSSVTGHNFSSLCLCTLSFSDWRLLFSATQSPQHQFQNLNAPDSSGKVKTESESHSVVSHSLPPHGGKLYSPWNSPGQNTRVGSLSLLQRIFPTQELNRGLLHCRWILDQLSYQVKWMLWEFHLNNNKTGRKFKTNFFQRHVSFGNRDK